ncbi:unnamed protein product [Darwinula stevensoni]|uniref:Peptidase S1 domain-containing protein n=1 Tax=Darwinula stevensoni TaxID=69355 RepID=A0A7R9AF24_9CRUS|nr:unnamed protein product [Darwinula stevensoni]CAG0902617.1 unnamed protein product [Darwinula stevensoni]
MRTMEFVRIIRLEQLVPAVPGSLPVFREPRDHRGTPATIAEAPWLVYVSSVMSNGTFGCTGSIIDQYHVLTAGHCIMEGTRLASSSSVRVGNENKREGKLYAASSFHPHPSYNNLNLALGHDIAVIKLALPLQFTPSIQPICIPRSDNLNNARACTIKMFGWGRITADGVTPTDLLRKVTATVLPKDECATEYDRGIICAKGVTEGTGTCKGDSGGPLVVYVNGIAYAMGVDSYGVIPCSSKPSRYTRITSNIEFISSEIGSG